MKTGNLTPLLIVFYLVITGSCREKDNPSCLITADISITDIDSITKKLSCTPAGGIEPYTYEWDAGSNTYLSSEITVSKNPNSDTVTVYLFIRDATDCVFLKTVHVVWPDCGGSTVTDSDGNVYNVVSIGSQCWMASNLKVSAGLSEFGDDVAWETAAGAGTPAWCWPLNSSGNSAFGKMYNWYAVESVNLCPAGWHIPTKAEWETLVTALGGDQVAGGKMKTQDAYYWDSPNTGATNSSGFSAAGAGGRSNQSLFEAFRLNGIYWSATSTQHTATVIYLSYSTTTTLYWERTKQAGYSCRCVKD